MHDVIVVGAGPAGAIAARDLARSGARVALVDGSHPREKPCGGGVTGRALEFTERCGAEAHTIRRAIFESGARTVEVAIDDGEALRIYDRETFDAALLGEAVAAGAEPVAQRAIACRRTPYGWEVDTAASTVGGAWLLGADGACGIVRKTVARPFTRSELSIASGSYVEGVSVPEIVIGFTDEPSGYLWSFPRRGRLAVGACAQADTSSSRELHGITDRWLDRYPPAASAVRRRYSWPIPSIAADGLAGQPTSGNRWMVLGDAAGLVDPITREGIYFALESGAIAASALGGSDPAREYAVHLRDRVHPELRRAARLKDAFFRPRFTRLLVDALASSSAIRAVMIDLIAGRQPYSTLKRRLLGTLEFGLMARVLLGRRS